jgi:hypothetical protein
MQIVNGKLVLGKKNCNCGDGTVSTRVTCKSCNGSGRGKRGGARGCKPCYGNGTTYDHDKRSVCPQCNGNFKDHDDEDTCDYLPAGVFAGFTFRVYYGGQMTIGEALMGLGCVFSCGDYGAAWKERNDEKLIADVRQHSGVQATKVVDKDNNVADHIGIFVTPSGYTVKPVFVTPAVGV